VDAVRRGYLGLMLFIIALVLMPLLVVDYHRKSEADSGKTTPASPNLPVSGAAGGGAGAPTASPAVDFRPRIVSFEGVAEGGTLNGVVMISLITAGDVGPIIYKLAGIPGQWTAQSSPYLFSPYPGGWRTSQVPNGSYTLTATPLNPQVSPRSVHFRVENA